MRPSAIELILDFTTTALMGCAFTIPFTVVAAAVGGWLAPPESGALAAVSWEGLRIFTFMAGSTAAVAALLARGVSRRQPLAIALTALSCLVFGVVLAQPFFGHTPSPTPPNAASLISVVLQIFTAGLLVVCTWQLKARRAESAR